MTKVCFRKSSNIPRKSQDGQTLDILSTKMRTTPLWLLNCISVFTVKRKCTKKIDVVATLLVFGVSY